MTTKTQGSFAPFTSDDIILQGEHARRFHYTLSDAIAIHKSLLAASRLFASRELEEGEVDARFTVEAFGRLMTESLNVMAAMLDDIEAIDHPASNDIGEEK